MLPGAGSVFVLVKKHAKRAILWFVTEMCRCSTLSTLADTIVLLYVVSWMRDEGSARWRFEVFPPDGGNVFSFDL